MKECRRKLLAKITRWRGLSVIDDAAAYVRREYGQDWRRTRAVTLKSFHPHLMSDYHARQHCSLACVTQVIEYWANKPQEGLGKNKTPASTLPPSRNEIFLEVEHFAYSRWLSSPIIGTFPWNIARIARGSFVRCLGKARAKNHYIWHRGVKAGKIVMEEIHRGRPVILSFSHNQYFAHSVTAYGYELFCHNLSGRKVLLVKVADNWSAHPRYVDFQTVGDPRQTWAAICTIQPQR